MRGTTSDPNCKGTGTTALPKGSLDRVTRMPSEWQLRMAGLATAFGFDGASYFLFTDTTDRRPATHWSTSDESWLRFYRRNSLHQDDPRLKQSSDDLVPLVWGALASPRRSDAECGIHHRILGGVAVSVSRALGGRAVICWDLSRHPSVERQQMILQALDKLTLVSALLVELIWSRPQFQNFAMAGSVRLTARESECLAMAANGMTSADIGTKLGIAQRTANFHFGNIIAKLHALNRGEAIARAIALGLYSPPPGAWALRG